MLIVDATLLSENLLPFQEDCSAYTSRTRMLLTGNTVALKTFTRVF